MSYCDYCINRPLDDCHRIYHDEVYGFPEQNDNELFGRLILEINQAGLSWDIVLRKQQGFRQAYAGFDISTISAFTFYDEQRLMGDERIIRNRAKIRATIHNAQIIKSLINEFGSFSNWLEFHHPKSLEEWNKLFKKTFKFVGIEIVKEFLMGVGFLPGAHSEDCPISLKIQSQNPKWVIK